VRKPGMTDAVSGTDPVFALPTTDSAVLSSQVLEVRTLSQCWVWLTPDVKSQLRR
jgi:hypothetical protein